MLEQLVAVLLLISCSQDRAICREQPAPSVAYQTMAECQKSMAISLDDLKQRAIGPKRYGTCIAASADLLEQDAYIQWTINANDRLVAVVREEHDTHEAVATASSVRLSAPQKNLHASPAIIDHGGICSTCS